MQELIGISIAFLITLYFLGAIAILVGGDAGALLVLALLALPVVGVPVLIASWLCPDEMRSARRQGLPIRRRARLVEPVAGIDRVAGDVASTEDEIGLFGESGHG